MTLDDIERELEPPPAGLQRAIDETRLAIESAMLSGKRFRARYHPRNSPQERKTT